MKVLLNSLCFALSLWVSAQSNAGDIPITLTEDGYLMYSYGTDEKFNTRGWYENSGWAFITLRDESLPISDADLEADVMNGSDSSCPPAKDLELFRHARVEFRNSYSPNDKIRHLRISKVNETARPMLPKIEQELRSWGCPCGNKNHNILMAYCHGG